MSPRIQSVLLIAGREVKERTRSRAFRLSTLLLMLIVLAAILAPAIAARSDAPSIYRVGFVAPVNQPLVSAVSRLGADSGSLVRTITFTSVENAERALRADALDILVVPGEELVTHIAIDSGTPTEVSALASAISDIERRYTGLISSGVTPEQARVALDNPPLPVRGLEPAPVRNSSDAQASTSGMILLFVFLTLHGAFILNGVIEEKSSRVVEILLSSVRPSDLLLGKVLGIGAVGSLQGVVLVVVSLVARAASPGGPSTSSLTPAVVGYSLLWFLLGFAVYAGLFACAGALVSRAEDAQSLVFPLQLPLIASYVVGLTGALNGPNPVLNAMSYIPFTAPMTMLERMSAQQVKPWEVAISIAITLVTAVLIMRVASVIYAGGILRSGQRVRLRDAWRNPAA